MRITKELYEEILSKDTHQFVVGGERFQKVSCEVSNWDDDWTKDQHHEYIVIDEDGSLFFADVHTDHYNYNWDEEYEFYSSYIGDIYDLIINVLPKISDKKIVCEDLLDLTDDEEEVAVSAVKLLRLQKHMKSIGGLNYEDNFKRLR